MATNILKFNPQPTKAGAIVDVLIEPGDPHIDPLLWSWNHKLTGTVAELLEETRAQVKADWLNEPDIIDWPTASIRIVDKFDNSEICRCGIADLIDSSIYERVSKRNKKSRAELALERWVEFGDEVKAE